MSSNGWMDSNAWYLLVPAILIFILWPRNWERKKNARRRKESDEAHARNLQSLDYFLSKRADFRERMIRYRGVPDVPRVNDAYIVIYLDGQVFQRLSMLREDEPTAIRLRASFLDYLDKLKADLGWIGFCRTDDDWAASKSATEELRAAEDMVLTLLAGECREIVSKAKAAGLSYFNEDGTFRSENTLNLPPATPP